MITKPKTTRGRPPLYKQKQSISVKIDKSLYKKVVAYGSLKDKGISFVVNEALGAYFKSTMQKYIENNMHVYIGDESEQED